MIAQACHASLGAMHGGVVHYTTPLSAQSENQDSLKHWLENSYRKIVVSVDSLKELLTYNRIAAQSGLRTHLVQDSGLTEFDGVPTYTALAIGPNWDDEIDPLTKDLKLL